MIAVFLSDTHTPLFDLPAALSTNATRQARGVSGSRS
jgi:hypothetical protein